jgi:hypothetical protein
MRQFSLFIAVLLFVATLNLPIGFYTALRILVFICALMLIRRSYQDNSTFWIYTFLAIAVVFNPIIPVYLHRKSSWIPIDFAAGLCFMVKAIQWRQIRRIK